MDIWFYIGATGRILSALILAGFAYLMAFHSVQTGVWNAMPLILGGLAVFFLASIPLIKR